MFWGQIGPHPNMRLALLILFIITPLIELALLIELGRQIGFWWTIAIVIATAVIGTAVLQQQGLDTIARINKSMAGGVPPIEPVVEGFFLLLAGAFLLTPGILTDAIGFLLLIPPLRRSFARWSFNRALSSANVHIRTSTTGPATGDTSGPPPRPPGGTAGGPIIDGDYERVEEPSESRAPHQDVPRK